MQSGQQMLNWIDALVGTVAVLTRLPARKTIRRLAPSVQAELATYGHAMTPTQQCAYLAKVTATERTAYLRELGLIQRFAALSPLDRAAVRRRCPYPEMRADALLFLWGEPYYTVRQTGQDEIWYYRGVSRREDSVDTPARKPGIEVEVYLVEGQVITWREVVQRRSASPAETLQW